MSYTGDNGGISHTASGTFKPGSYKVLYTYRSDYPTHEGLVKVGDASIDAGEVEKLLAERKPEDNDFFLTSDAIEEAAHRRILQQHKTAGTSYDLASAFLAIAPCRDEQGDIREGYHRAVRDHELHNLMLRNGVPRVAPSGRTGRGAEREWFRATPEDVVGYFKQLTTGAAYEQGAESAEIVLREEQRVAVQKMLECYKVDAKGGDTKKFLLSAIMRYGKTITAYSMVKEHPEINTVLIITHRPVVLDGWHKDFDRVLKDQGYEFASASMGRTFAEVRGSDKFVYFASIQDLRGSFDDASLDGSDGAEVDEIFSKNQEVFQREWDLVIVDEAHEGTQTDLAQAVSSKLKSKYALHLSGTAMNIADQFTEDSVFEWTYHDERAALRKFEEEYPEAHNPYSDLPGLEILNYSLREIIAKVGAEGSFSLAELFRTKDSSGKPEFVYKESVNELLNLISANELKDVDPRLFPFSNFEMMDVLSDTLWVMPSVSAAKAMQEMLQQHVFFRNFATVNVAGDAIGADEALTIVRGAIDTNKRTITLTRGRLTTGVTVPEWSAVFLFSGMRSPISYLQTIFRAKSSGSLRNGMTKTTGYVFDFDPDRSLEMAVERATESVRRKLGEAAAVDHVNIEEELNTQLRDMPIYDVFQKGGRFRAANAEDISKTINKVFSRRIFESGWDSPVLFDLEVVGTFTPSDWKALQATSQTLDELQKKQKNEVTISESGLVTVAKAKNTKDALDNPAATKEERSEAEKAAKAEAELKKNIRKVISAVLVRVPFALLSVSGKMDVHSITPESLPDQLDDSSWYEIFGGGFHKRGAESSWEFILRFLDKERFRNAAAFTMERVREIASMPFWLRLPALTNLLGTFRHPDKETVLTQGYTVNRQATTTVGGLDWMDSHGRWRCANESYRTWSDLEAAESLSTIAPVWLGDKRGVFGKDSTMWESNSKSALYPVWTIASMMYARFGMGSGSEGTPEWNDALRNIVEQRVFVNSRLPYAADTAKTVIGLMVGQDFNSAVNANVSVSNLIDYSGEIMEKLKGDLRDRAFTTLSRWVFSPATYRDNSVSFRFDKIVSALRDKKSKHKIDSIERKREEAALAELNDPQLTADVALLSELGLQKFIDELEKRFESEAKSGSRERFTLTMSNPPYQITVGGRNHQVYPGFYTIAQAVSESVSMVFPLGWQTSSGRGSGSVLHESMRKDDQLVSVDNYYEINGTSPVMLFRGTGTGGVSVVYWERNHNNNGLADFYEYSEFVEQRDMTDVRHWDDAEQDIFDRISGWRAEHNVPDMKPSVAGWNPFGFAGYHTTDSKRGTYTHIHPESTEDATIPAWTRNKVGAKYDFWYPEPHLFERDPKTRKGFDKWKVIWPKSGAYRGHRSTKLLKPGEVHSDTFISSFFESRDKAEGFESYFKTFFYRHLTTVTASDQNSYSTVHRFVPDLSGVENPRTGRIGWDSDWTDEDLKILFKDVLTDEDWDHIKKSALASDNGKG